MVQIPTFVTKLRGWFLVFESRMRTMISTASLPFASIECSTVVSEIRFILAIGILSKPQTEKFSLVLCILIHIMHLGFRECNHIIVSNEGRIRSLFENLFYQIVSGRIFSIFETADYTLRVRERILTQSSPKPCSLKVATSAS